jgi:hypothetical protein
MLFLENLMQGSGHFRELVEEPLTRTPPYSEPIVPYEGTL